MILLPKNNCIYSYYGMHFSRFSEMGFGETGFSESGLNRGV